MPVFRRHQRACESSDGPPLYHTQVTNACMCTFLHAFSGRITTSSIKKISQEPLSSCLVIFEEHLRWAVVLGKLQKNHFSPDYIALLESSKHVSLSLKKKAKPIFASLSEKYLAVCVYSLPLKLNLF